MEDTSILLPAPVPVSVATGEESITVPNNKIDDNSKFNTFLNAITKDDQEKLRNYLNEISKKMNEQCALTHMISQLEENGIYVNIAKDFKNIYQEYNNQELSKRHDRIFTEICSPCTFVKLGLINDNIEKRLDRVSCLMTPSNSGEALYNLGPFIHAATAYQIDDQKHPHNINNNYAKNVAFPPGVIILPDSQIMMQILAMNYNQLINGVKICMINSDEENITDPKIITRFMSRNPQINCGYYKRNYSNIRNLNKCNKKRKVTTTTPSPPPSSIGLMGTPQDVEASPPSSPSSPPPTTSSSSDNEEEEDVIYTYIPEVDDDNYFDENNIFKNGEPLIYKKPNDDALKPDEIGMRVFDLNNTVIKYIKTMTNLQNFIEKQFNQNVDKKKPYFQLPSMIGDKKLIANTFYDLLSYAYHGTIDYDKLLKIPPLDGKCLLHQYNILFVNRNGKAITITPNPAHDQSLCTSFKYVMKNMKDAPLAHKIIPTAANTNLTSMGNVPDVKISTQAILNWDKAFKDVQSSQKQKTSPTIDEIKAQYSSIVEHHIEAFQKYHSEIKASADILKNYYCEIKDDMGETIPFDNYETIYDISRKIYPETVLDTKSNIKRHTLDYSVKNTTKPIIDKIDTPNIVYVKNLGFVSLTNICNLSPLTLRGSTVYYQNLINRFSKERSAFIVTSSDTCKLNNTNDDNEEMFGNVLAERASAMPQKHVISNNAIKVFGEGDEFDHSGHLRRLTCDEPSVHTFLKKYQNEQNPSCIRSGL